MYLQISRTQRDEGRIPKAASDLFVRLLYERANSVSLKPSSCNREGRGAAAWLALPVSCLENIEGQLLQLPLALTGPRLAIHHLAGLCKQPASIVEVSAEAFNELFRDSLYNM